MIHPRRTGIVVGAALAVVSGLILFADPASGSGPSISSFSPSSADVGTTVTIDGSGLSGATEVAFNFNNAPVVSDTDSQITTTVPLGNDDGPLTVTTSDGTALSATDFTLLGLYVTTTSLPSVPRGSEYSVTLQAAGGRQPYRWRLESGRLPPGLTLTHAGVLSGILTRRNDKAGTYDFTVVVRDSTRRPRQTAQQPFSLTLT